MLYCLFDLSSLSSALWLLVSTGRWNSVCACRLHIYYYYIRLMAFFSRTTWILLEQEMMWWQWHQLDHMQIICTSLQTNNQASTSPLIFYRPDALPAAQPTASKHCMCNIQLWL